MGKPKVKVELKEYCYRCADGCCTEYGTTTVVNGFELPFNNQDVDTILQGVLEALGYEVEIDRTYNGD